MLFLNKKLNEIQVLQKLTENYFLFLSAINNNLKNSRKVYCNLPFFLNIEIVCKESCFQTKLSHV